MSHIDEQIAEALTHGPDTLTYILAQALTTARARVAELEARPVVVPEPTSDEWRSIAESARSSDMVDFLAGASAYGLWLRGKIPSAIPADRALIDVARVLQQFVDWCEKYPSSRIYDYAEVTSIARQMDMIHEAAKVALRASQGGAAT